MTNFSEPCDDAFTTHDKPCPTRDVRFGVKSEDTMNQMIPQISPGIEI